MALGALVFFALTALVDLMDLGALLFFDFTALVDLMALGALVFFDLTDLFDLVVFLSSFFGEIEEKESLGSGLERVCCTLWIYTKVTNAKSSGKSVRAEI